jgi:ribosomal protein S27E
MLGLCEECGQETTHLAHLEDALVCYECATELLGEQPESHTIRLGGVIVARIWTT